MKRTIIILASALVIFIVTLLVTNRYMSNETVREADRINNMHINSIKARMDLNLSIRENAVHSFLAGIFYYDINDKDTVVYVTDKEVRELHNEVYDNLTDFAKLHPNILSASFLIEPGVYPDKGPKGFAPTITSDGTRLDYAQQYDYAKSENYLKAKNTKNCFWALPSKSSQLYKDAILHYVPIYRNTGDFYGVFTITVSLDVLRDQLKSVVPYEEHNCYSLLVDQDKNIILSTLRVQEEFDNIYQFRDSLDKRDNSLEEIASTASHTIFSWKGDNYYVYSNKLDDVPWEVMTCCPEACIYKDVQQTRQIIIIVALLGMLLMLVCCLFVFRDLKKNIQQKAAAQQELDMAAKVQQDILKPTAFTLTPTPNTQHPTPNTQHPTATVSKASAFDPTPLTLQALMRPAREAGGDLYDYIEVRDQQTHQPRLLFCLGDVSGKGMPAALFMTQVVSLFRNAVSTTHEPHLIATQINNVLANNNPEMTFCTLFIASLDPLTRTLTYCNAGHNRPVIIPPATVSKASAFDPPHFLAVKPNLAIGLMEGYPYQSETTTLPHGHTILLYSDGVTEAMNAPHEQYGEERLLQTAANTHHPSPNTLTPSSLLASVDTFVAGYHQSDDITIMTVS